MKDKENKELKWKVSMKLSIIVPVYNVEKYVQQAIDSLLKQNFDNYEIIIINDGSTDSSLKIIKDLYEDNSKVIIINQNNKGLSAARNVGLKRASGKYIMYLDSDDYLMPNTIGDLYTTMVESNADLGIFGGRKFIDGTTKTENFGITVSREYSTGIEAYVFLRNIKQYYTAVYYQIVKKDLLDKNDIKFIENIIHEDHPYTYKVLMKSKKTVLIPRQIYIYRVRPNSIMTKGIKYDKRFTGFATAYLYMKEIECSKQLKLKEKITVKRHLDEIKWIATKYLCRMNKIDEKDNAMLIEELIKSKSNLICNLTICFRNFIRFLINQGIIEEKIKFLF